MLSPLPEVDIDTRSSSAINQTHQQPLEQALVGFVVADPVPLGMACLYVLLAFVQTLESSATSDSPLLTCLSDCLADSGDAARRSNKPSASNS